jgi:hypothetical protein
MNRSIPFALLSLAMTGLLAGCTSDENAAPVVEFDVGTITCEHLCADRECGDDGCGGSCGLCGEDEICQSFTCVSPLPQDVSSEEVSVTDTTDAGPDDVEEDLAAWPIMDDDLDQIANGEDNCPTESNPDQADLDEDTMGDACDPDIDGDGHLNELDCAPTNPEIHPAVLETCGELEDSGNAIDEDCDGETDEPGAVGCTEFFSDGDGDGVGVSASMTCLCVADQPDHVTLTGDCDDADPTRSPLEKETCDDVDENCNLLIDEGCDDDGDDWCDSSMTVAFPAPAVCPLGGGDCYDYSAEIHPDVEEIPADGLDNNCDGIKEGDLAGPIETDCGQVCTGGSTEALLCALEICYPTLLQNAQVNAPTNANTALGLMALEHYGAPNNALIPWAGDSYVVLSSGKIEQPTFHADKLSGESMQDPYNDKIPPDIIYDVVEFEVQLMAPAGVTGFSIDYLFLSTEYDEYIGSTWNDKLYIVLDAPETTGGVPQVINYTECSDEAVSKGYADIEIAGQEFCFIAVNTAFSEPCSCQVNPDCLVGNCTCPAGGCNLNNPGACMSPLTDISGTGYECSLEAPNGSSTGWLTTTWDIVPGEVFTLTFHIHDTKDFSLDSAAILDNFRWEGAAITKGTAAHN